MSVSLIVAVVGGLVYLATLLTGRFKAPSALGELGRLAFGIGLFCYLFKG